MVAPPALTTPPVLHHIDALPAGTRLVEFELQALVGVGGFGLVYRAYDHSLHRTVAIKEYMPSALAGRAGTTVVVRSSGDHAPFTAGLQSFMDEARLLAQFDHPSLVKVFRVWEQNSTAYIVMPFYQGVTLQQAQAEMRNPPPEAWWRLLLWPVLEALKVLHLHHMVHRDLSPDNIFLQDIGPPVLLDLGAARRAIGDHTQRHTAILKVHYAPIEQYADAEDLRQGPWSDLYALAAVVHGCLSREAPAPATFRVLRDRLLPLEAVAASLHAQFGLTYSTPFIDALTQALAIQPEDRPQSVAALAEQLQLGMPLAMERFDWRRELGCAWQPAAQAQPTAAVELPTQRIAPLPRPQPQQPEPVQATRRMAPAGAAARGSAPGSARRGRRPVLWGVTAALVCSALAGIVTVWWPAPALQAGGSGVEIAASIETPAPVVPADVPADTARAGRRDGGAKAPARAGARALSAQQICPDSNFLTRPICLHRECQKPRFASMPVCVENNRRLRDSGRQGGA